VLLNPGGVPRTSSGKIQRYVCRRDFLAGSLQEYGRWRATGHSSGGGLSRAAVLTLAAHERVRWLENYFRGQLARLLRLDPDALDLNQPVSALGLDSLATVELKNALVEGLGVTIPVSSILAGASIAELVAQVTHELNAPVATLDSQVVRHVLHDVRQLSDDQIRNLLDSDRVPEGGRLT
jgi:acyl carrier protein